jgi:hypothetical protein
VTPVLRLVPCSHFWLEMTKRNDMVIAICKFCKQRGEFTPMAWDLMGSLGRCKNKPPIIV